LFLLLIIPCRIPVPWVKLLRLWCDWMHKRSLSCQDERENGLNKAYPCGKQAQVQYINLAWMNEIGKKMWHISRSKFGKLPQAPVLVKQWERTLLLWHIFTLFLLLIIPCRIPVPWVKLLRLWCDWMNNILVSGIVIANIYCKMSYSILLILFF
jgi:hypothetical protein